MKKVIFDAASEDIVRAVNVKNKDIIGYQRSDLKGVLLWDEGQGKYIGASLINGGDPSQDRLCPYVSQGFSSVVTVHASHFVVKANQLRDEETKFFVFDDMLELLTWLIV